MCCVSSVDGMLQTFFFFICGYFDSSHISQLAVFELLKLAYMKNSIICLFFCGKKHLDLLCQWIAFCIHAMLFDFEESSPALQEYHHLDPAVPPENSSLVHLDGTFGVLERTLHKV